jgi:hypothetical protein
MLFNKNKKKPDKLINLAFLGINNGLVFSCFVKMACTTIVRGKIPH